MTFETVDGQAATNLATKLVNDIREHYAQRPTGRATVYEILNALAAVTALIVSATGKDEDTYAMRAWFDDAIDNQLEKL